MVTLITQSQSEFALHLRAVLGLPLEFVTYGAGASAAYKSTTDTFAPNLNIKDDIFTKNSFVRVFGKPETHVGRRMAVSLVLDDDIEKAKKRALEVVYGISEN